MPSKQLWRLRFGYFPNEDWFLLPRVGVLNSRAENCIAWFWLARDGELTAWVYWLWFEVSFRLKTRPAQGIKGVL